MMATSAPEIVIRIADVREVKCDVLILKYAQSLYGADRAVVQALTGAQEGNDLWIGPGPSDSVLLPSQGAVAATRVLFLGVVPLLHFEYSEIRRFAADALRIVSRELPGAKHVAMTIHGAGYGLDERESFLAQLGGIGDAMAEGISVRTISIVERDEERAGRLRSILESAWPEERVLSRRSAGEAVRRDGRPGEITAGIESRGKAHVFVAMPFSKELEDVYIFGIQGPVNNAGYLCERVDMLSFTGDILHRIKKRIETASLVVAELTGASPNVYLEVGYAWGRNRPTLLLAKKSEELKFDVQGQRCIVYENIFDLSKKLQADLALLPTALKEPMD